MFESPIFEGTIEELVERREEFAGQHLSLFATPEAEAEEEVDLDALPPPPDSITIRDRAHLFQLFDEALASPLEPLADNEFEMMKQEVARRLAERKTAK